MSKTAIRTTVGIRDLKNQTSAILRIVKKHGSITVTSRSRPIAIIVALGASSETDAIGAYVHAGRATWKGGKPKGLRRRVVVRGPSVADAVIKDRR